MKEKILFLGKSILRQELISGSMYIFIGSVVANIFNLFFNLFMSRNLTVEGYGILASTISLIVLMGIPVGAITPVIVSFAGSRFAKEDYGSVKALFFKIIKPTLVLSILIFIGFTIFSIPIGNFFQITDESIIVIVGFAVILTYVGIVNTGFLQAKLAFKFITFSNLISAIAKLSIGVSLVFLGLEVQGAILAVFISGIIPIVLGFIYLRDVFFNRVDHLDKIRFKDLISYGIPSSLTILGMTSLISTDILLVKHFFDPLEAGIYAGMSLVGKVIFFLTSPIGNVMFPLIIKKNSRNESYNSVFKMAVIMVLVPSIIVSIFYFLYPNFAISIFIKNETYLSASNLLGLFGIFIVTYSLISLFVYYFLSIKKTNVYIPVVFVAIIQAIFIIFYHESLLSVVLICIVSSLILLVILSLYFLRIYDEYNKLYRKSVIIGKTLE